MNESNSQPSAKAGSNKKTPLKRILTLLQNLICLSAWTWLVSRIVGWSLPDYVVPLQLKGFIASNNIWNLVAIGLGIAFLAAIVFRKMKRFVILLFLFWVRLVLFPFVALFYLIYIPYRSFSLVYRAINSFLNLFVRTTMTKAAVLLVILVPASILVVNGSENGIWLLISLSFPTLAIIIALRVAFVWTSKPLIIIEEIVGWYIKLMNWYMHVIVQKGVQTSKDPAKQLESMQSSLAIVYKSIDWSQSFVEKSSDQRVILKFFFGLFATCFTLIVISFGVMLYGLVKFDSNAFTLTNGWQLFDYIYASLVIITTSGGIGPQSATAKLAVAFEICCGISLLSFLVFQFSLISIPEALETKSYILRLISSLKEDVDGFQRSYLKQDLPSSTGQEAGVP